MFERQGKAEVAPHVVQKGRLLVLPEIENFKGHCQVISLLQVLHREALARKEYEPLAGPRFRREIFIFMTG
jgi:hypothetical protein